jgi:hypothetical protein
MKVKELIELLQTLPADSEVILSKDSEGNRFSPLCDYSDAHYQAETTWSGEIWDDEEAEPPEDAVPCVVLWPTN